MPFVKGQSGNPKGRPRVGVAVATIVRATVDPEQLIKILFGLVQDMTVPANLRIVAARELLDRGWGKAPAVIEIDEPAEADDPFNASRLTLDELRELQKLLTKAGAQLPQC